MVPFLPWTGFVPVAAVGPAPAVFGFFSALSPEVSPPPWFANAIAAIRRTTTPTTMTREREVRAGRRP